MVSVDRIVLPLARSRNGHSNHMVFRADNASFSSFERLWTNPFSIDQLRASSALSSL